MDGLAPRSRRSDRPMVSLAMGRAGDRTMSGPVPGRTSDRSSQARTMTLPGTDDAALTMGRRIGVLVVLAALLGAIVLAANGSGSDRGGGVAALATPTPTVAPTSGGVVPATTLPVMSPPVGVPEIVPPEQTLVRTRRVDLRIIVPDPGVAWEGMELRVLRGAHQVAVRAIAPEDLSRRGRVTITRVPLKRGANKLTVALGNPGGQGPASASVTIRVDDQPPRLKVLSPRKGSTLNQSSVVVRGRTGPGLRVVIRNVTTGTRVETTADASGAFRATLPLKRGRDTLAFAVRDAAGNLRTDRFAIVRGNGKDEARLSLSRDSIRHSALPRTIDATVTVLDADGRPIKGAPVVFTFGPPGLPTQVHEGTTSKEGRATWSGIRIVRDTVVGNGWVTVLVTLSDGRELSDTVTFEIS